MSSHIFPKSNLPTCQVESPHFKFVRLLWRKRLKLKFSIFEHDDPNAASFTFTMVKYLKTYTYDTKIEHYNIFKNVFKFT